MKKSITKKMLIVVWSALISIVFSPLAWTKEQLDIGMHSRSTRSPVGFLQHQTPEFIKALQPFIQKCRTAGRELYLENAGHFPYDNSGQIHLPKERAWYLEGIDYDTNNPNVAASLTVSLFHENRQPFEIGHLPFVGQAQLDELFDRHNRSYIQKRGGSVYKCELIILGHVGLGKVKANNPIKALLDAETMPFQLTRQYITLLIDGETTVISHNELYATLNQKLSDTIADNAHRLRAEQLVRINQVNRHSIADTTWRPHGDRKPGSFARVRVGGDILYHCELLIDGKQQHSACRMTATGRNHFLVGLKDAHQLTANISQSLKSLEQQVKLDIQNF